MDPISTRPKQNVHAESSIGEDGMDVVFRSIKKKDEGTYTCSSDIESEKEQSFDLFVVQSIDFQTTPLRQSVRLGEKSHTLKCLVSGHPFPVVTWKAKGQNVRNTVGKTQDMNNKYEVDGTDLIINAIEKKDEGEYLCKAVQRVKINGITKYSDFREMVIDFRIERKIFY